MLRKLMSHQLYVFGIPLISASCIFKRCLRESLFYVLIHLIYHANVFQTKTVETKKEEKKIN